MKREETPAQRRQKEQVKLSDHKAELQRAARRLNKGDASAQADVDKQRRFMKDTQARLDGLP